MPGGTLASWAAMPPLGWAQIIAFVAALDSKALQEGLPKSLSWDRWQFAQDPNRAPGDVASQNPEIFTRYSDPAIREFKLNAERNNGRAAMMGIIGMMIHEALTGNPLFPIPIPPQPVLELAVDDIEKGPARVGSFVLASLGMAFCGIVAAIPELS